MSTAISRAAVPLVGAALLAAGFAACGGDAAGEEQVQGLGEVKVGSVAPLAQCRDWNSGTEAEKLATIEDIRSQINLEDAPVRAPALSDEQAYEVLERGCAPAHAASFRLYRLYAQAAAFQPLLDPDAAP